MFLKTLTADEKYPVEDFQNLQRGQFKCNYLKNEKPFHNILFHFCNLHQTLNVLEEKMVVIGNVLPKLETAKNLDRTLSEKPHYRTQFDSQNMKASQMLSNST